MFRFFISTFIFSALLLSSATFAQDSDDFHVVHVQKWTMKSIPIGDEADSFDEMLKKQSGVINNDPRVLSSYVLRHFWGADSRDLVMIAEFKNSEDLFAFYKELGSIMEKSFSKEELDKDDALFNKYVGEHADEIYRVVDGTSK